MDWWKNLRWIWNVLSYSRRKRLLPSRTLSLFSIYWLSAQNICRFWQNNVMTNQMSSTILVYNGPAASPLMFLQLEFAVCSQLHSYFKRSTYCSFHTKERAGLFSAWRKPRWWKFRESLMKGRNVTINGEPVSNSKWFNYLKSIFTDD